MIKAVRIQDWLSENSKLKGRRGGSTLLTEVTSRDFVHSKLAADWEWDEEAGDIDGAVSLKRADAKIDVVRREVAELLEEMAAVVPGLSFEVFQVRSNSDIRDEASLKEKQAKGQVFLDYVSPPTEAPMGRRCDYCGVRPSSEKGDASGLRACSGCAQRIHKDREHKSEEVIRVGLADDFPDQDVIARDFKQIAKSDSPDETQIALIYADGNKIGAVVSTLIQQGVSINEISACLAAATRESVVSALREAVNRDAGLKAIPHLIGGDDILLSVPASSGWQVTRHMIREFPEAFKRALGSQRPEFDFAKITMPSLSAGLVFHRYDQPISEVIPLAGEILSRQAKRLFKGRAAAVAWADTSFDGVTGGAERLPVRFDWLVGEGEKLVSAVAAFSTSKRYTLRELAYPAVVSWREDATQLSESERSENLTRKLRAGGFEDVSRAVEDLVRLAQNATDQNPMAAVDVAITDLDAFRWLIDLTRWM